MPAHDVELVGSFKANTDTKYTVEHYKENLDGTYAEPEVENKEGTTDATINGADVKKTYEGFTYDASVEGSVTSGVVAADGSLVLKLYYTRNSYKVTYKYDKEYTNAPTLPADATYKFGQTVSVAANVNMTNYTFNGWKKDGEVVTSFEMPAKDVTLVGSFTALQIGIRVQEIPNMQWVFQKGKSYNLGNYITVYEVYADGTEKVTTTYTDDFSTDTVVENKTLTITENGFTDTSIKYKVQNEEAAQTKFEVILKSGKKFRRTTNYSCTRNCNTTGNTTEVELDKKVFEVIEHYDQNIQVISVIAKYASGNVELNNIYAGTRQPFGRNNEYGIVRWSRYSYPSTYDPVYIYGIGTLDNLTSDVSSDENKALTVEVTYARTNYGTYKVTFKNVGVDDFEAIDEEKISNNW